MDKKNTLVISVIIVALLIAGIVYWFFIADKTPRTPSPNENQAVQPSPQGTAQSLGGEIYEQAQNPLQDKLPSTNPVQNVNPIENVYTNPFE